MFPSLGDFRFALRRLRKAPGFVVVCVLTLALGVGANTAVFSVMHAILLKSLPVQDPSRVFYVNTSEVPEGNYQTGTNMQTAFSYPAFEALRKETKSFRDVMLYVPINGDKLAVRYGAEPEQATGDMVSGNFFTGLGVPMELGRGLNMADETQHAATVVISYSYWERRFAKDPKIVGQTLFIKGFPFTIVGVAGAAFEGTEEARSLDIWIPLQSRVEFNAWGQPAGDDGKHMYLVDQKWWNLRLLARVADGVTPEQAVAMAQAGYQRAAYAPMGGHPKAGEKPVTLSLKETKGFPNVADGLGQPLQILMGMVGLVLLIALSNVAMMLLARSNGRQREFSIRAALGARRGTLLKELLAESLLLVTAGGALAWLFAESATRALAAWSPQIESSLQPDRSVMLFALGVLAVTAGLFGVAPLRNAMKASPGAALKTGAATASTDASRTRFGRAVVVMQIALCLTLLVGAGLVVRTLQHLREIPLGFKSDGLVVFGVSPQAKDKTASQAFYTNLLAQLRALPNVEGVTMTSNRMGSGWTNNDGGLVIDGVKLPGENGYRNDVAAPDTFKALGVPMVSGRDFSGSDTATSQRVLVVNESFVKKYMPKVSPLGHSVGDDKPYTIIGVVKDYKYNGMNDEPHPMVWGVYTQGGTLGGNNIVLRVKGEPMSVLPAAQHVLQSMDPNLPLERPELIQTVYDRSIAQQALFARLAGFFGLLAVVLVATGLYGVLAYRVGRQTVEIGVRMAVGAQRWQVVWMVLRDCLLLMLVGMAVGVPLSIALGKQLASQLYGVKPGDAASYALAIGGVLLVCVLASAIPARRAASVEPVEALRAE